jgi:hypothetical protein
VKIIAEQSIALKTILYGLGRNVFVEILLCWLFVSFQAVCALNFDSSSFDCETVIASSSLSLKCDMFGNVLSLNVCCDKRTVESLKVFVGFKVSKMNLPGT